MDAATGIGAPQMRAPDVDLVGLLDLLGEHLYSTPAVAVRELIQNAHDSIVRRRMADPAFTGGVIRLLPDPLRQRLVIEDDGAGLSGEEIVTDLATIGRGGTRAVREQTGSQELIGLFGIGFLSAFVVATTVTVTTTAASDPTRGWRYRSSGGHRYSLDEVPAGAPGTRVELKLRDDASGLADATVLEEVASKYAALIRVPVYVGEDRHVNADPPPWRQEGPAVEHPVQRRRNRLAFAARFERIFEPIAAIDVEPEGASDAFGVIWVQDASAYGSSDNRHVYLYCRGMLVDDDARELLPRWAGFCGAVLESNAVSPTASREDARRDEAWEAVRNAAAERLISGLAEIARDEPAAWRLITTRHNEALLGAAIADDRLFALLRDHLTVPTTSGDLTAREVLRLGGGAVYLSMAEGGGFEEMVCRARGIPVVSGIRYGVLAFLRRWTTERNVALVELGTEAGDQRLFTPVDVDSDVVGRLRVLLADDDETVVTARFEPATLPLLPVRDREVELKRRIEDDEADRRISTAALGLARLHTAQIQDRGAVRLYVNLAHPAIQRLRDGASGADAEMAVRLLVGLKSLLAGPQRSGSGPIEQAFADISGVLEHLLAGDGSTG